MIEFTINIPLLPTEFGKAVMADFKKNSQKYLAQFGKVVETEMKRRIRQTKGLAPLSPRYRAEKMRKGWSPLTLIRTRSYLNSIKAVFVKGQLQLVAEGNDPVSDVPYSKIAVWLEYGTVKMPARPHWRPMVKWSELKFQEFGRKLLQKIIEQEFKK